MINDLTDHIQIDLFEGPERLINFAFPVKFDEHLSLPRPGRQVREDLEYQWIITSRSVIQPCKCFPQNGPASLLEDNVPNAAVVLEVFFGAVATSHLPGKSVGEVKISRGKMTVRRLCRQSNKDQPNFGDVQGLLRGERLYDGPFIRFRRDLNGWYKLD
jgi:hypothetical protein